MGKNLNTQIWTVDSDGYTQSTRSLFTSTPPVFTHADHIDTSFNYCVNGVATQSKRAVLHLTDRTNNVYTIENIDNTFIPNNIYDEYGNNYSYIIHKFIGTNGGVSNFAISADSQNQPSGGTYKTRVNFEYLSSVWSPRINIRTYDTTTHSVGSDNFKSLNDMDAVCTNSDALENETWWEYCARNESKYILTMDKYNDGVYITNGAFQSTSVFEGQTRAGISAPRVSWLNTPHSYGNSYGTSDCIIYYGNGRDKYADMTFDALLSLSSSDMVKKDEWDDTQYSKPRHNILFGIKIDKNLILSIISSYGLPFSFKQQANISIGNADYALPEVKNNTTTGNYFRGADAITADTDNNRWANTADIDNKPAGGGGGGSGDKIDDMNMNALWAMSSDAGFARYFLLSHDQLASLMTWLSDTTFPDGYDPYAYILSLLQFPLKLSPLWCMPRTPSGHIVIGGQDTNITASLIANEKPWVGAGTYDVPQLNGNFLDYDPYTQYELYIPCCGWVSLPDIVCGRKIAVKINYDLTTAAIIGNVYVTIDGKEMIVASKSGMMGRETIVTGEAQGVRSAQITSALLNAGTGALNVATGAMSGNAVAAVSGGYNIVAGLAQANIAANSAYTRTIGSTGGRAILCQFDQCYLKICTTRADIPDNYGHTCGYVCNLNGKVSAFTGYTVFDNVDVSGIGKATDREKKLIKQILESGVIINPTE